MNSAYDLSLQIAREAVENLIGDQIGIGAHRTVYACKIDPSLVVKIEDRGNWFQNVTEWRTWESMLKSSPICRWFAPCVSISSYGQVLLMKRCDPLSPAQARKARLPMFFTDRKPANFGMLDGRVVCMDYGTIDVAFMRNATSIGRRLTSLDPP